jgi:hypothetical protein
MLLEISVVLLWLIVIGLVVVFILLYSKGDFERAGPTGPVGPSGSSGIATNTGATGPRGLQGTQGTQGPQGPQGTQGNQGTQGFPGNIGPTGLPGGNKSIIAFNSVNNYINSTYQFYTGQSTTESAAQILMPGPAIISGFTVKIATGAGTPDDANTFTLRVNGNNTQLFILLNFNNTFQSSNQSVQVNTGDLISVFYLMNGNPQPTTGTISYVITLL